MKILHISCSDPSDSNSAGNNRLLGLLKNLDLLDIEIHVLVLGEKKLNYVFENISVVGVSNYSKYFSFFPISLKRELADFYLTKNAKNISFEYVSLIRPDIIWVARDLPAERLMLKLKKVFNSAVFFTEVSEYLDIHRVQKVNLFRRVIEDFKMNFFLNKSIKSYGGIALMTRTLLNYFKIELVSKKQDLLHLPMTVDLNRFNLEFEQPNEFKKPYIAFVGMMNNIKDGVDVLISAFSYIEKEFPNYNLYLVGPWQPDINGHLQQIQDLKLSQKVYWMKTFPRELIPPIISNAEMLVLPRPESKQAKGGFPTKLGEYLATGRPVCATSVGELSDYLEDEKTVFFADPGSVESFANAMIRALKNPELAKKVGQEGRKVAEREFNASIQARKLKNFFDKILKNKKYD